MCTLIDALDWLSGVLHNGPTAAVSLKDGNQHIVSSASCVTILLFPQKQVLRPESGKSKVKASGVFRSSPIPSIVPSLDPSPGSQSQQDVAFSAAASL